MSAHDTTDRPRRADTLTRVSLGVIAACLLAQTAAQFGRSLPVSHAIAAPAANDEAPTGLVSAGIQRKDMIAELKRLSAGLQRVENALADGIRVQSTDSE